MKEQAVRFVVSERNGDWKSPEEEAHCAAQGLSVACVVFVGGGRAFIERFSEVAMPVVVVWVKRRRSSGSARSGETSADEIEQTRPAGEGGHKLKTTLMWDGELDQKGMIRRFP